jgi:FtsP/CotA-like multicopper oxidase with cupredoxin domain
MSGYLVGLVADAPLKINLGDRVEVTMRSTGMIAHSPHLHGLSFHVVSIHRQRPFGALHDTVHIEAQRAVTIALDAEHLKNLGPPLP